VIGATVRITNAGIGSVSVRKYSVSEDGWGVARKTLIQRIPLGVGESALLEISGDTRNGGHLIEIEEYGQ
jgi:hypothetical protein